ncbi:hypothetical protein BWI15_05210 [Kribbella sp. ALI-6-A]|uniref:hypothetical protein n=1 Tax=Kribbella sp. ALI-6-A TaxID=1933817 RepID=UPI00097C702E|nr:hypothetical protein [Kribbella sp. ALI-6-A]ONI76692.1 hypothetical protein BWI15_05210 [Kribbella sp. ALI-6-A]
MVGPDGVREDIPPLVFDAVRQVIDAMRAGRAVKISPLRTELPIDEAADAIGMARDDFRAYVAEGAIPFRSTDSVDWVDLATVIAGGNARPATRAEGIRKALQEDPWEDADARPST